MRRRGEVIARISCLGSTPKSTRADSSQSKRGRGRIGDIDVAVCERGQVAEQLERMFDVRLVGRVVFIFELLDDAGREGAARRQLEQPEPLTALDDDVHPAVLEHLEHVRDPGARADLVHRAVARRKRQPELRVRCGALVDQLPVARFEDVQRDPFGRDEHDRKREETELRHSCSLGTPEGCRVSEAADAESG